MIAFSCKSCDRKFLISDRLAGRKGLCPTCHEMFVVPSEDAPTEESEPVPSKKTRAEVYVRREDIDEEDEAPEEEPEETEEQEQEEEEEPPPPPRRRSTAQMPAASAPARHAAPEEEARPQWKRAEEPPPSGGKRVLVTILFCGLAAGAGWFARGLQDPRGGAQPAVQPAPTPPRSEDPAIKPPKPQPKIEDPPVKPPKHEDPPVQPVQPPKHEDPPVEPVQPPKHEDPPVEPVTPPKHEDPPVEPVTPPKHEDPPVEPVTPPKHEDPPVEPVQPPKHEDPPVEPVQPPKHEDPPVEPPPTPSTEAPPPAKDPPSTDASAALAEFDRRRSEIEDPQDGPRHIEAMEALAGVLADPHVVDRLGELLVNAKEPVPVRTKAAQMLGDGGGQRAQALLERGFQSAAKEVRVARAALFAMAKTGTPESVLALDAIVRARANPPEDLQDRAHASQAIKALGTIKRRDAIEALMRLFVDIEGARPRNRADMSVDDWKVEGHLVGLEAAILESLSRTAGQTLASYEDWVAWWTSNQGNFK